MKFENYHHEFSKITYDNFDKVEHNFLNSLNKFGILPKFRFDDDYNVVLDCQMQLYTCWESDCGIQIDTDIAGFYHESSTGAKFSITTDSYFIYEGELPNTIFITRNHNPILIGISKEMIMITSESSGFSTDITEYTI